MKNIIITLLAALVFLGCSSQEVDAKPVEAKLVLQKSVADITLNDQHEKAHNISADTKILIFAFSKDIGHICNDFFATKTDDYLIKNNAMFIADVSSAPSIIRSMFIMPGLKDFKHTVLVIDDENLARSFKSGQDSEKIIVVSLENNIITAINTLTTVEELSSKIEQK